MILTLFLIYILGFIVTDYLLREYFSAETRFYAFLWPIILIIFVVVWFFDFIGKPII